MKVSEAEKRQLWRDIAIAAVSSPEFNSTSQVEEWCHTLVKAFEKRFDKPDKKEK